MKIKNNILDKKDLNTDKDNKPARANKPPRENNISSSYSSIGEIIRRVREENNVERKELAEFLDIPYDMVFDIENDRQFPSIKVSILFCSIFNINRDDFLDLLLEKKIDKQTDSLKKTFKKNLEECLDEFNILAG